VEILVSPEKNRRRTRNPPEEKATPLKNPLKKLKIVQMEVKKSE
jgi:hypothetical protein